ELVQLDGTRRVVVRGWDFKMIVGRVLGWNMIKSSRFEVTRDGADFVFRGSGFGHGLGLCQEGAHEMARLGFSYSQIMSHYFPGTSVATHAASAASRSSAWSPALVRANNSAGGTYFQPAYVRNGGDAWPGQTLSSEHFTVRCASCDKARDIESALAQIESARSDMLERLDRASLSLPSEGKVQLIFHGSTQEFMAATGQPFWAAAATRGAVIELQPMTLLKRRRILTTTIRHEYAHYVIDRLSARKSPRWLAEGLAAHFAGESAMLASYKSPQAMSADQIEQRLSQASSPREMRSLYAASLEAVEHLIKTNGEPAVWRQAALGPGV